MVYFQNISFGTWDRSKCWAHRAFCFGGPGFHPRHQHRMDPSIVPWVALSTVRRSPQTTNKNVIFLIANLSHWFGEVAAKLALFFRRAREIIYQGRRLPCTQPTRIGRLHHICSSQALPGVIPKYRARRKPGVQLSVAWNPHENSDFRFCSFGDNSWIATLKISYCNTVLLCMTNLVFPPHAARHINALASELLHTPFS